MSARSALKISELLVVIRLGETAYGVTISRALEESTGRDVVLRSVYAALDRLEDKGYIHSRLGDPTPERGGRAKRYFHVTARGMHEASTTQHALSTLWSNPPALEGETAGTANYPSRRVAAGERAGVDLSDHDGAHADRDHGVPHLAQ